MSVACSVGGSFSWFVIERAWRPLTPCVGLSGAVPYAAPNVPVQRKRVRPWRFSPGQFGPGVAYVFVGNGQHWQQVKR